MKGFVRRLWRWKYIVAVVLICWGAIYVSNQYQYAAKQCDKEATKIDNLHVWQSRHAEYTKECTENAARDFPRWYSVVRWPDGITILALILTLLVIAEQTGATKRAAEATEISNDQNAAFFKTENRPWVGISKELTILEKKSTKAGQYEFTVEYTLKNFGSAPALNVVVPFGPLVEDVNNYNLVKDKVARLVNLVRTS